MNQGFVSKSVKMFQCNSCQKLFQSLLVLLRHIRVMHILSEYKCVYENCSQICSSIVELQRHALQCNLSDSKTKSNNEKLIKNKIDACKSIEVNSTNLSPQEIELFNILSKLYADPTINNTSVDDIVVNIQRMSTTISEYHKNELKKIIPIAYHKKIDDLFKKDFFSNADSEFKRLKYFKECKSFVAADKFLIGSAKGMKKIDGVFRWGLMPHYGYHLSLSKPSENFKIVF